MYDTILIFFPCRSWSITDVFGLDDEMLAMVPKPEATLLLLFPITDQIGEFYKEQQNKIDEPDHEVSCYQNKIDNPDHEVSCNQNQIDKPDHEVHDFLMPNAGVHVALAWPVYNSGDLKTGLVRSDHLIVRCYVHGLNKGIFSPVFGSFLLTFLSENCNIIRHGVTRSFSMAKSRTIRRR